MRYDETGHVNDALKSRNQQQRILPIGARFVVFAPLGNSSRLSSSSPSTTNPMLSSTVQKRRLLCPYSSHRLGTIYLEWEMVMLCVVTTIIRRRNLLSSSTDLTKFYTLADTKNTNINRKYTLLYNTYLIAIKIIRLYLFLTYSLLLLVLYE